MGSESEFSVVQSIGDNEFILPGELGNHNEKIIEEIETGDTARSESVSPGVSRSQGLRKWRRIPRDLVKKTSSDSTVSPAAKVMVNVNGDARVLPVFAAASDPSMRSEASKLNGGNSVLPDDQLRNGRMGPGKKARAVKIEKEDSNSTVGSDSRSSNFVFEKGSDDTVASKSRQSGAFTKYDKDSKNDAESDDDIGKEEGSVDLDPLLESVKGLHIAQAGLEREVQKWREVGNDDLLSFDDPLHEALELKDAKILELESMLNYGEVKTVLEDRLMKIIQMEVEYVVLATTTKILTEGPLSEIKHDDLERMNVSSQEKKDEKLQTKEDLKKLQNRVCKFTSCFIIMLILLLVTLYLKFSPQNVEVVPT